MKNIYILIGGGCNTGTSRDNLSVEILKQINSKKLVSCNLLFVNFGKEEQFWQKTIEKYSKTIFCELLQLGRLNISIASFDTDILIKQFQSANIIFFTGGSELLLKKHLSKKIIPKENKIIIGNSAGTNIFSKFYFSNDRNNIEKGMGILPINTLCHFSQEKEDDLNLLSNLHKFVTFSIEHDGYLKIIY